MGKRQEKHPFEDNPFLDDLGHWMQSAEGGLSSEVLDVVWTVLEKADVDAHKRKIILAGWEKAFNHTIRAAHLRRLPRLSARTDRRSSDRIAGNAIRSTDLFSETTKRDGSAHRKVDRQSPAAS